MSNDSRIPAAIVTGNVPDDEIVDIRNKMSEEFNLPLEDIEVRKVSRQVQTYGLIETRGFQSGFFGGSINLTTKIPKEVINVSEVLIAHKRYMEALYNYWNTKYNL